MTFEFNNNTPIYVQIVDQLKMHIISGKLCPGEKLPSVRELALMTKVNPNTVQKALGELEDDGLIFTERTNGKFVTNDAELISKFKKDSAESITQTYLTAMKNLGFTESEVAEYLKKE